MCSGARAIGYGVTQERAYASWKESRSFMNMQAAKGRDRADRLRIIQGGRS